MQDKRERPAPGERAGRKYLQTFRPTHSIKNPKHFQGKSHWSRHPKQRELDRSLLAIFGLEFKKVPGTNFHRLGSRKEVA